MEIQPEELRKIIKFYRIHHELKFIGFRAVDPDTFWYFFRDKKHRSYILCASDYIWWVCGNDEPPKTLINDYFTDFPYSFTVKKWLTSHDGLDSDDESGDYEGHLYWASNGDRCVMAEVEGEIPKKAIQTLVTEIPVHDELEIAVYARRFIGNEVVSSVPRPSNQNPKILEENIRELIRANMLTIAEKMITTGVDGMTEEELKACNSETFRYARMWPTEREESKPDWMARKEVLGSGSQIDEEKFLVDLNNQSWLALCELRDFPNYFDERSMLFSLLKRYVRLHENRPGPKFLPRQTIFSILEKFEIKSAGRLSFQTMIESAKDCKLYIFYDELDVKYVLICRDIKTSNLDQEKNYLSQESDMVVEKFYNLKSNAEKYYYVCDENEAIITTEDTEVAEAKDASEKKKYYFLVGRIQD